MNITEAKKIVEFYVPINTKEKVDELVDKLRKNKALNADVRLEIHNNIQKTKIQLYFIEKYPKEIFTDKLDKTSAVKNEKTEVKREPVKREFNAEDTDLSNILPANSLGEKKYIYGTYIEMAFHNLFLNLRHIYAIISGSDIMEEAGSRFVMENENKSWDEDFASEHYVWNPMLECFRGCKVDEKLRTDELLARHFPFLEVARNFIVNTNNREYKNLDSIDVLERMSQCLRFLRNVYSHCVFAPTKKQLKTYNENIDFVIGVLNCAYIGSKRVVKQRFAFSDEEMKCTDEYIFHGRTKKKNNNFRYGIAKDGKKLTEFGLVLLNGLFLEKKYAKIFADKTQCISFYDQKVVCEMISVYRLRLHIEKFYVSETTDAIALDIINELRKCPKELFELLRPEVQQQFRVPVKDGNGESVLMVRNRDRFAGLVLRYIDEAHLFENIRFQVSLGKYFYKFYDKCCIDSETRVRSLSKGVNGFGRLSEIDEARTNEWQPIIRDYGDVHKNTASEQLYVTDHHSKYILNGNKIGLRMLNDDLEYYLPELPKESDGENINLAPTCWLSTYELPAMAFMIHLKGASFVEEIIKGAVLNFRKLFQDISEGKLAPVADETELSNLLSSRYEYIGLNDIPKDMRNFLLNKDVDASENFERCSKNLIDTLIEQTSYKLERLASDLKLVGNCKQNKFGKKNYVSIKPGGLATFLASDIMFFQPNDVDNTNKLTGLNYRVLQSVLALYEDGQTDALTRTLRSAHIIGDNCDSTCNPIASRMWGKQQLPKDTLSFYKMYLEERLRYLKECRNKNMLSLPFLHPDRQRWQKHDEDFYRAKAMRYLRERSNGVEYEKSIELPRGLFENAIRKELVAVPSMRQMAQDESKNISYLIYGYFMNVMSDDCQDIYRAERSYPYLNKLFQKSRSEKIYFSEGKIKELLLSKNRGEMSRKQDEYLSKFRSDEKQTESEHLRRLFSEVKDNESVLKRYKVQDMLLLLIAKKILMSDSNDSVRLQALDSIHLKDLMNGDVLSQKVNFQINIESKNGFNKTIYQNDLKIKDYSQFYRFVSDRRLPSLLDLVKNNNIERLKIDEELAGYDKVHPDILKSVFEFEKMYIETHDIEDCCELKFSNMLGDDESRTLGKIRGSFAHCTYPPYKAIDKKAREQELPKKAVAISDTFTEKIKNVISK